MLVAVTCCLPSPVSQGASISRMHRMVSGRLGESPDQHIRELMVDGTLSGLWAKFSRESPTRFFLALSITNLDALDPWAQGQDCN